MEYQIIGGLDADEIGSLESRFWDKIDERGDDDCWLWQGGTNGKYGRLYVAGGRANAHVDYVHRIAYELFVGPIPDGYQTCHACDVPLCANPKHLFVGTAKDNSQDMVRKGRANPGRFPGEKNPKSQLTREQVLHIRRNYKPGAVHIDDIAAHYGVTGSSVRALLVGRTWKHVGGPIYTETESPKPNLKGINQGTTNGQSVLTPKKVREIRAKYRPGQYGYKRLGKEYGVSPATIRKIVKSETWTHVQ